ncbi:MAG: glycoside hydrolase family 2 protein [Clostridia bacterium]|nr:glycoside hydrolase family 2 protein [Clostridia bacterium]
MRKTHLLNQDWIFTYFDGEKSKINIPHTWNNIDGQDGGNDYRRGTCIYEKDFVAPQYNDNECVYLEFAGVNASAKVILNDIEIMTHDGGYSTFRCDITEHLKPQNHLTVEVDNSVNDRVYPQKADFTFYGGIYRDVRLIVLNKQHFDMDYFGGNGLAVSAEVEDKDANVWVRAWHNAKNGAVNVKILDDLGVEVATACGTDVHATIYDAHLWQGIENPYLYTCQAELVIDDTVVDSVSTNFGVRSFYVDSQKGFFLNGKPYALRGVCRHQDRKGLGNALLREHHEQDMDMIREIGANTIRLAHYQHDQYFYDLCDRYGFVVWAEIPYISEHMVNGRENTISQMKELIVQNYNHASICFWGLSNEITISTKNKKDMLDNHRVLNDLVHEMDPSRPTTLACYAVCGPFNPVAHISDIVSWNLYLGWYTPFLWLNDLWVDFFHLVYPNRALGYSEYGCEAMTNLHSSHPYRGDQTEEYQCVYHEYMLRFFEKRPFMWATHLWNMFDFAADARNQGGEPGMNHKGLVTFDRKIKKDSFYLYKAYWSNEKFVHICGSRYVDRIETVHTIKVYSNCDEVTLYANGEKVATKKGNKVFKFKVTCLKNIELKAVSGDYEDTAFIRKVHKPNLSYKLKKGGGKGENWV